MGHDDVGMSARLTSPRLMSPSKRRKKKNAQLFAHKKNPAHIREISFYQQLPILPGRLRPSTFGVYELNYRVRHGYGCVLIAIATESFEMVPHFFFEGCSLKTIQKKVY